MEDENDVNTSGEAFAPPPPVEPVQPPEAAVPERPVEPPPVPEPQDTSLEARVERAIQSWVVAHLHGSPVSRDTEAFNHVIGRLGDLRRLICEEIGQ